MDVFGLDIASIVDLGTRVAHGAALRAAELSPDSVFDYIIAVAIYSGGGDDGPGDGG